MSHFKHVIKSGVIEYVSSMPRYEREETRGGREREEGQQIEGRTREQGDRRGYEWEEKRRGKGTRGGETRKETRDKETRGQGRRGERKKGEKTRGKMTENKERTGTNMRLERE